MNKKTFILLTLLSFSSVSLCTLPEGVIDGAWWAAEQIKQAAHNERMQEIAKEAARKASEVASRIANEGSDKVQQIAEFAKNIWIRIGIGF